MKICIPVLTFTKSGGARVLSELASAWIAAGHEVSFLCAAADSRPHFPTQATVVYGSATADGGLGPSWNCLRQMVRNHARAADLMLANFHLTAWAVWAAGREARHRCVYYAQAYEPDFYADHHSAWRGGVLRWLARRSYGLFPRVVVNAPIYLDYPGVQAIGWVPPGIDFQRFHPRANAVREHGGPLVLGCIGRPEAWKGTSDVFAAAALLQERGTEFVLRSAFYAPTGFSLLANRVQVPRPRNDDELADFYRSCDLLVAPGTVQLGAPHYPVMEAMACNVPVITTGYMPADRGNALIVPVGQPAALANAVDAATADPHGTRLRAARALDAITPFAWPEVAARFLRLVAAAADEPGTA